MRGLFEVGGEAASFSSPRDAEAAGIAMIPQELDLFPELSVAENLFVGRKRPRTGWGGLDWDAMRGEARKRLDALGVSLDATSAVKRLSAAEQQIVAIARALVGEARAVIMDEPTSSLTGREARQLFGIIEDLTAEGVGVVYISHRLEEIFEISDRITVLRDGHHIKTAPASELDAEELVRLMVGRPLNELFTRSESSPGETVLEVRGLTREGEFEDVDLALRRGEILGLAGLVGAGPHRAGPVHLRDTPLRFGRDLRRRGGGQDPLPANRDGEGYILRARGASLPGAHPAFLHQEQHHPEHPRPHLPARVRAPVGTRQSRTGL